MSRFLLDTNVLSQAIRHPNGPVADRIRALAGAVCTSIIVAGELRFGAAKSGSRQLASRVDELLQSVEVIAFEAPADRSYARIRAELEQAGAVIGPNDLLIAAHALALGATLVTDNEGEFARVSGLKIENWLR